MLRLANVTKRFGGVIAVQNLSIDIGRNEILGLIGPNGAGKSTVLNMIAGVYRPTEGQIWYRGKRIDHLPAHKVARLGIARANQIPRPFGQLTVADNVRVAAHSVSLKNGERRSETVDELLEQCGLLAVAARLAGSLTLLSLKRLEVARALALAPDLLLLDEVAAGLTGKEIDEIVGLIRDVHSRGITVLLVEHVQAVIQRLAQRVVVLEWGRHLAEGTPTEIAANPDVQRTYLGTGEASLECAPHRHKRTEGGADLLRVEGLAVDYGKLRAIQGADFSVRPNEIVALLGANGAGKSTIVRSIVGLQPAAEGRIWLDGVDITGLRAHQRARRGIAVCQEGRRLFRELTVRENLQLGARYSRSTKSYAERLESVVSLFPALAKRMSQVTGSLSGGQQQMVAIARALIAEPRLLILDELSLGLAPAVVDEIYATLEKIRSAELGILLVEQSAYRSLAVADHAYVVERGRISLSCSASEARSDGRVQKAYFGGAGKVAEKDE